MMGLSGVPTEVAGVIARAARRRLLAEFVRGGLIGAAACSLLALLIVGMERLLGGLVGAPTFGPVSAVGVVLVGAVAVGMLFAWRGRWSASDAADELDTACGLGGRLGASLGTPEDAPIGVRAVVMSQAASAAGSADSRLAVPMRTPARWWIGPIAGAMALASAVWLPGVDWSRPASVDPTTRAALNDSRDLLESLRDELRAESPANASDEPTADEIERLAEELASDEADRATLAEAAGEVERLAEAKQREAERSQEMLDELTRELTRVRSDDTSEPSANQELSGALRDAMARGDMDQAAEAAEELSKAAEAMSEEDRQRLASELREMADSMSEPGEGQGDPGAPQAATGEPRSTKVNNEHPTGTEREPAAQVQDGQTPKDQQSPESNSPTPPVGERPTESTPKPSEQADPKKTNEQVNGGGRDPSQTQPGQQDPQNNEDTGERGQEKTKPTGAGEQTQQSNEQETGEGQPTQKPSEGGKTDGKPQAGKTADGSKEPANGETTQDSDERGNQTQQRNESKPVDQGQEPAGSENAQPQPDGQPGRTGDAAQRDGSQPPDPRQQARENARQIKDALRESADELEGKQQPSATPDEQGADPGAQQPQEGTKSPDRDGSAPESMKPEGAQPEPGGDPEAQPENKHQGESEQPPKPGDTEGEGIPESAMQRLRDQFERLRDQQDQIPRDLEQSEKMRETAERMLEKMSPEQREELNDMAREFARGERDNNPNPQDSKRNQGTPPMPGQRGGAGDQDAKPDSPRNLDELGWSEGELVDARPKGDGSPGDRLITERPYEGEAPLASGGPAMTTRIQKARESAERGIERQSLPARHADLIRRVFERYEKRAKPDRP